MCHDRLDWEFVYLTTDASCCVIPGRILWRFEDSLYYYMPGGHLVADAIW